jgi:hypothetical protein
MCRGKGDPEGASVAGTVVRIFRGPVSALFRLHADHATAIDLADRIRVASAAVWLGDGKTSKDG